jgi:hypothetical protein
MPVVHTSRIRIEKHEGPHRRPTSRDLRSRSTSAFTAASGTFTSKEFIMRNWFRRLWHSKSIPPPGNK